MKIVILVISLFFFGTSFFAMEKSQEINAPRPHRMTSEERCRRIAHQKKIVERSPSNSPHRPNRPQSSLRKCKRPMHHGSFTYEMDQK